MCSEVHRAINRCAKVQEVDYTQQELSTYFRTYTVTYKLSSLNGHAYTGTYINFIQYKLMTINFIQDKLMKILHSGMQ